MKKIFTLLFFILTFTVFVNAQIQKVTVEKYYISDAMDALDSTNWYDDPAYLTPVLPTGSITYRVYVQLDSGYKIKKIYGTSNHPLKIMSTANFFNNIDRATSGYFGYTIKKTWFSSNPTIALDSWLTLGLCTNLHTGLLKTDDPDGSVIDLPAPWLGTTSVAAGLLRNTDPAAGIPIDTADGMVPKTGTFTTWIDNGFKDLTGTDTTVFGSVNVGSQFISTDAYLQQNSGVTGDSTIGRNILVAQLTTTGDLSFELNLELIDSTGVSFNFVADNHGASTTGDTAVSGLLKYPPVCGCKDPNFLEYNANYSCSASDSCHTRIVYGCMDTLACNYDPHANYNIQYLCCYPGSCADRDIALVCPAISGSGGLQVFPNPATDQLTLQFSSGNGNETKYAIYDAYGTAIIQKELGDRSGSMSEQVDISSLHPGLYLVRVFTGATVQSRSFMKN